MSLLKGFRNLYCHGSPFYAASLRFMFAQDWGHASLKGFTAETYCALGFPLPSSGGAAAIAPIRDASTGNEK